MSIIINLKPEAQAELTRQAAAHGVQPEAYAANLLEAAVHLGAAGEAHFGPTQPHTAGIGSVLGEDSPPAR
jgi:hypothetical protein